MLEQSDIIFAVCYKPYDGSTQKDNLLADVRRKYFTSLKCASGKVQSLAAGVESITRYKIGRTTFQWEKISGKTTLQKAYCQKGGYYIITRNMAGETVSKARYGADHLWLQTAYYSGDTARPEALLKPKQDGGLVLLRVTPGNQKYTRSELEFCAFSGGTAEQSLVNAIAGEPLITCETKEGSFFCCLPDEQERRAAVENDLRLGKYSIQPDWTKEQEVPLNFTYIKNDEPFPQPKPEPPAAEVIKAPQEPDYAANREIFSTDEPERKPAKYSVAAKGLDGQAQFSELIAPHTERAAKRIVISAEESYLYFGKVIDGLREGRGRTQMQNGCTAYEGGYHNDKRDGFGAYYYKSGKICYVGDWKENRRNGAGVSYSSRDGSIFVGKWKDNIPTGIGTAFDNEGNLIYTGEWKDGKRHGHGTEYKGGKIVFSGEFREDKYYSGYEHIEYTENTEEK